MGQENIQDRRFWLGLVFVIIGGVLLLDNLNIIPYYIPDYLLSWKTFLIVLGAYLIVGRKKPEPGIILIVIGSVFLLQDFYYFRMRDVWHIIWPSIFIIIGASLILRRSRHNRDGLEDEKKNDLDYMDDFAVFGGREIVIDSQNFKGGKISAIMGGSSIDLRNANLSEGNNVLDILALFGGTSIIVPPDWTVKVEVVSILGGFSDKRSSPVKVIPHPNKVLTIKGFVMFGGGDIKYNK
jgi:predicted membrane protein